MSGKLEGKVAIITGGASGIGTEAVKAFIEEGAKVVVADIQDERGQTLADTFGDAAIYVHADVTDEESVENLVAETVKAFGKLDIMYNNAGAVTDYSPLIEMTSGGLDKTLALLTRSVALGHKYAAKQFQAQGTHGSIVTTASAAGIAGGWGPAGYTIAKHAVLGVVAAAVVELAPLGIRSNAIAPGIIMTPLFARTYDVPMEQAVEFADFLSEELKGTQPIGRTGRPEDIARAAVFLASDDASFITGAVLPVDGGATAITQGTFGTDVFKAADKFRALKK